MASRRLKQALMARRRRSDGTFMNGDYMEPWARSGSFGVNPDGTSYPITPSMVKRDSRGRFTSEYNKDDGFPGVPPVYRQTKRPIGFAAPNEFTPDQYGTRADITHTDEFKSRNGEYSMGHAESDMDDPMTRDLAMRWVKGMKNADGSTGPHWTMDQANQIMEQMKIQCDEVEFFVALNMMYSDYCKVAKRYNCSTMEFYASLAKAFLNDTDAQPNKLMRYYECIVEH